MAAITITNGTGSVTTATGEVAWLEGTVHSFLLYNTGEGPVRLGFNTADGLDITWETNASDNEDAGDIDPERNFVTLDGNTGMYITGTATAVNTTPADNIVTFRADALHTGIRAEGEVIQVALFADVSSAVLA